MTMHQAGNTKAALAQTHCLTRHHPCEVQWAFEVTACRCAGWTVPNKIGTTHSIPSFMGHTLHKHDHAAKQQKASFQTKKTQQKSRQSRGKQCHNGFPIKHVLTRRVCVEQQRTTQSH